MLLWLPLVPDRKNYRFNGGDWSVLLGARIRVLGIGGTLLQFSSFTQLSWVFFHVHVHASVRWQTLLVLISTDSGNFVFRVCLFGGHRPTCFGRKRSQCLSSNKRVFCNVRPNLSLVPLTSKSGKTPSAASTRGLGNVSPIVCGFTAAILSSMGFWRPSRSFTTSRLFTPAL